MQHALQVTDRLDRSEAGFAQIHLIPVFQRAQQFHAIERAEIQIGFEIRLSANFPAAFPPSPARSIRPVGSMRFARTDLAASRALHNLLDGVGSRLLRGGARKVVFAPHKPLSHALVLRQCFVGAPHHRFRVRIGIAQDHDGAGFGVSILRQRDHHDSLSPRVAGAARLQDLRDTRSCRRGSR